MTRMRDLEVGPADPSPTAVPDALSVIEGGPDPDGSGRGVRAPAWLAAAAGRIPGVRLLRRRPVSPLTAATVSAAVAALLAGGAVAVYQQRPVEVVSQAPVQTRAILEPESWLVVEEAPWGAPPVRDDEENRRARDQALTQHPPEATVTMVLTDDWPPDLVGLPPGSYQVRASCTVSDPPDDIPGPIMFSFDVHAPESLWEYENGEALRCDGAVHPAAAALEVTDYRAYIVTASVWVELPEELRGLEDDWYPYDSAMVVVSVTEV